MGREIFAVARILTSASDCPVCLYWSILIYSWQTMTGEELRWNKMSGLEENVASPWLWASHVFQILLIIQVVLTKICVHLCGDLGRNWGTASSDVDSFHIIFCMASASSIITTTFNLPKFSFGNLVGPSKEWHSLF